MTGGGAPRVLVTRAAEDAPVLAHALALAGFEPVVVPVLERRWAPLAVAALAERQPRADWVVVTSAAAAEVVAAGAPNAWREARWAAVGPATADRLTSLGYAVERVPDRATARDLVAKLGDLSGKTVIHPRADVAPPATVLGLREAGAEVFDVVAYENAAPVGYARHLQRVLPVSATTLLSGSAAERIAEAVALADRHQLGRVVAIGPSTEVVARALALPVHAVAEPHTVAGVVAAVGGALGPAA